MTYNNNSTEKNLLPSPEILSRYKELGLGEDLVKLVKEEQKHRHNLQKKYLLNYRLGQLFGFILMLFFLKSVFNLVEKGFTKEAYILSGVFILSTLVIVIILRVNNKIGLRNRLADKKRFNNMNNTYNQQRTYQSQRRYNSR